MTPFVLLDRDGVINRKLRNAYVMRWRDFVFLPGALDALRQLREAGYATIVVSNQAGVGKGVMTSSRLDQITRCFLSRVTAAGGLIHGVYYCPHRKEVQCNCRKPRPGLLLKAQHDHEFKFTETYMVGDSLSDLLAAQRVGCPSVVVSPNPSSFELDGHPPPEAVVPDLLSAVSFILQRGENAAAARR
ncbi:MAG: D-glycero-alpha-D-manno-heptose-1,7-bisphosphate 7-phosphatase [Terriglobia bacterium]